MKHLFPKKSNTLPSNIQEYQNGIDVDGNEIIIITIGLVKKLLLLAY